ncbi:hypothetical protein L1987_49081 [Smallanthus sonchifolius]|uniref:Uncharacterized protein n=1 Tax=Smallanthus sonchifolius TaxID=185202 RepID=A0ACB9FUC4_9ASTR|nr:hypothetical protein L1987_49081 [Smallanthus sonchifolius]
MDGRLAFLVVFTYALQTKRPLTIQRPTDFSGFSDTFDVSPYFGSCSSIDIPDFIDSEDESAYLIVEEGC